MHDAKALRPVQPSIPRDIERELLLLRSAVMGLVGRDPEGEYRPEYVERVFAAMQEEPTYTFTTPEALLAACKRI